MTGFWQNVVICLLIWFAVAYVLTLLEKEPPRAELPPKGDEEVNRVVDAVVAYARGRNGK
jgi:hypothetical protein